MPMPLSTLNVVREACFERFEGGTLGVANGLRRDGNSTRSEWHAPA
jgi:hypothetical protein